MDNVRTDASFAILAPATNATNADKRQCLRNPQLAGPDMLIDGYDQYNQQENEVVNISPGEQSEDAAETPLRADDCECLLSTSLLLLILQQTST